MMRLALTLVCDTILDANDSLGFRLCCRRFGSLHENTVGPALNIDRRIREMATA